MTVSVVDRSTDRAGRPAQAADHLVTAAELASRWGVSRAHVYNLMKRGLPSVKVGNARRFRPSQADAWLDDAQEAA